MENSVIFAKYFGVVFAVSGLGVLINKQYFKKALSSIIESEALQIVATFVLLLVGSYLVISHNVWTKNWAVLITLVGWLMLLSSAVRAIVPSVWIKLVEKIKENTMLVIFGFVTLAIGIVLLYFGYTIPA